MFGSSWLIVFAIFADPFLQIFPANEPEMYEFHFTSVKGAMASMSPGGLGLHSAGSWRNGTKPNEVTAIVRSSSTCSWN
ncbi:hypothetical protein F5144DRAFT_91279 [Chaetomium tenue]|uniref:Uncharacterized protein n=1 Tax=Chaetomium tenue TaxID=1854479 RepID=A0ACB7PEV4_9PEZI|nr:hypothetical protein F5144DRAFT_91279 [Chaetomium globosum]